MAWPTIEELKDRSFTLDKELVGTTKWYDENSFRLITDLDQLQSYLSEAAQADIVAADLETSSLNSEIGVIAGVSMAFTRQEAIYIPLNHARDKHLNLDQKVVWSHLQALFNKVLVLFFNGKFDVSWFEDHGIKVPKWEDASISCYLLNPNRKTLGLKHMSEVVLGRKMLELEDVLGKQTSKDFTLISPQDGYKYAAGDALNTLELHHVLKPVRDEQAVVYKIETAAAEAVRVMERNRVLIDVAYCRRMWQYLDQELRSVKAAIFEIAKRTFDIDSPKQCGDVLFNTMKIPNQAEKTKTGQFDTSAEHLDKLKDHYPICSLILTARSLAKSRSTYVEKLIEVGESDPRGAKFCFFMTRVPTGRMASGGGGDGSGYAEINVQSIPATYSAKVIPARKIIYRDGQKVPTIVPPVGRTFLWEVATLDELVTVAAQEIRSLSVSPTECTSCLGTGKFDTGMEPASREDRPEDLVDCACKEPELATEIPKPLEDPRLFLFEVVPDEEVKHLQVEATQMPTQEEADSFLTQLDPAAGSPTQSKPVPVDTVLGALDTVEAKPAPSIVSEIISSSAGAAGAASSTGLELDAFLATEPAKADSKSELSVDDLLPPSPADSLPKQALPPSVADLVDLGSDITGGRDPVPDPPSMGDPTVTDEDLLATLKVPQAPSVISKPELAPVIKQEESIDDLLGEFLTPSPKKPEPPVVVVEPLPPPSSPVKSVVEVTPQPAPGDKEKDALQSLIDDL